MRLPLGDVTKLVDADHPEMGSVVMAYRDNKVWIYACSGRHACKVEVATTQHDIEELSGLGLPAGSVILFDVATYQALRKALAPIRFEKLGTKLQVQSQAGPMFYVQHEPTSLLVERIEDIMAKERPLVGTLSVDARLLLECKEALRDVKRIDGIVTVEVPQALNNNGHPLVIRSGVNWALCMSVKGSEFPTIDKVIEQAQRIAAGCPETFDPTIVKIYAEQILAAFGMRKEV